MQNRPICWVCPHPVDEPIYEAACGHDTCSSVVFHGTCLMEWREHREGKIAKYREAFMIVFERRQR